MVVMMAAVVCGMALGRPDTEPKPKIVETKSGLKYEDLKVGDGDEAKAGMKVKVHYTGWLAKGGKKFDSSHDRKRPFEFPLGAGRVIKGWDEGVAGMKVGGKRKLHIPAKLAYGDREVGDGLIPAGSDLVFEVELLGVEK
jgi:FKBP-type peptidyl-prolyl cis-trans isomerase